MTRLFSLLVLSFALLLSGCTHRAGWLHGKWVFDSAYTQQKLEESGKAESAKERETLLGTLKGFATGVVAPRIVTLLEGSQLLVTDKELILTGKDGNGKAIAYEVVEKPNADTITLKLNNGEVNTYHREGDLMWTASSSTLNMRAYFRRAQ